MNETRSDSAPSERRRIFDGAISMFLEQSEIIAGREYTA